MSKFGYVDSVDVRRRYKQNDAFAFVFFSELQVT